MSDTRNALRQPISPTPFFRVFLSLVKLQSRDGDATFARHNFRLGHEYITVNSLLSTVEFDL